MEIISFFSLLLSVKNLAVTSRIKSEGLLLHLMQVMILKLNNPLWLLVLSYRV